MLQDSPPQDLLKGIAAGRLDGGFVGIAPAQCPAGIQLVPWQREPLMCFVPTGHRLAGKSSVALAALAEESFVAVSHESAPAFAAHVQGLCKATGFRPRITLESPRAQAVVLMVAAGSGIAILPAALGQFIQKSVHAIPLKEAPSITHVFACQRRRAEGPLAEWIKMLPALKRKGRQGARMDPW